MIFESLKGQAKAKRVLASILSSGRIPSTFLFVGPRGVGKKIMADAFIKALLCQGEKKGAESCANCAAMEKGLHPDVKIINADYQASLREEENFKQRTLRVDTIRHLRQEISFEPLIGGWKAAVIEDAETLETQAANALLKILEEPPRRTLWILLSAKPGLLPKTILSRVVQIPFAPLSTAVVREILLERGVDAAKAKTVAELSEGSVGKALELLEKDNWPEVLTEGPMSAIAASEGLSRELPLARKEAEFALFSLSRNLGRSYRAGKVPFDRVEKALREISWLKSALRSNADPRATLLLACLEAQGAQS